MKVHGPVAQNEPIPPTDPFFRVALILIIVKHDLICRKLFLKTSLTGVFRGIIINVEFDHLEHEVSCCGGLWMEPTMIICCQHSVTSFYCSLFKLV